MLLLKLARLLRLLEWVRASVNGELERCGRIVSGWDVISRMRHLSLSVLVGER